MTTYLRPLVVVVARLFRTVNAGASGKGAERVRRASGRIINYPDIWLLPDLRASLACPLTSFERARERFHLRRAPLPKGTLLPQRAAVRENGAAQEVLPSRRARLEVGFVLVDEEPFEDVDQGIGLPQVSAYKLFGKSTSKSRKTTRLTVAAKKRVSAWATALQNTACIVRSLRRW